MRSTLGSLLRALVAVAWLGPLGIGATAAAQPGGGTGPGMGPGGGMGPCAADAAKLCAQEPRGPARMRCLRQHEGELSPACREHMAEHHARMAARAAEVRAACADEVARWCADVQPGQGGLVRCLRAHESELSPGCREKLPPGGGVGPAMPQ